MLAPTSPSPFVVILCSSRSCKHTTGRLGILINIRFCDIKPPLVDSANRLDHPKSQAMNPPCYSVPSLEWTGSPLLVCSIGTLKKRKKKKRYYTAFYLERGHVPKEKSHLNQRRGQEQVNLFMPNNREARMGGSRLLLFSIIFREYMDFPAGPAGLSTF